MGIRGVSLGSLLLIFLIIVMIFGTGRLRSTGRDFAEMLRGFKEGLNEANKAKEDLESTFTANNPEQKPDAETTHHTV